MSKGFRRFKDDTEILRVTLRVLESLSYDCDILEAKVTLKMLDFLAIKETEALTEPETLVTKILENLIKNDDFATVLDANYQSFLLELKDLFPM